MTTSQQLPCCAFTLLLEGAGNDTSLVGASAGTPLPFSRSIAIGRKESTETELCLVIRCVPAEGESVALGRLVWSPPVPEKECEVVVNISLSGEVEISVRQQNQLIDRLVFGQQEG